MFRNMEKIEKIFDIYWKCFNLKKYFSCIIVASNLASVFDFLLFHKGFETFDEI